MCKYKVWDLTYCGVTDDVALDVISQTPIYTSKLKDDVYCNLRVCDYELDKCMSVLFLSYSSRKGLFMKKLFVNDNAHSDQSINVETVQDHTIRLDEPLLDLNLVLSKEHALLTCTSKSSVWVCTDELEVVQTVPDISEISPHCTAQSAVICIHPVPLVLVLLKQGLLIGYSLYENTPLLEHEVSNDRLTDPPLSLHTQVLEGSDREIVLVGFKSSVRKFEIILLDEHTLVCREGPELKLPRTALPSLPSTAAHPSAEPPSPPKKSPASNLLLCLASLGPRRGAVVVGSDGVLLCDEAVSRKSYTLLSRMLSSARSITSAQAGAGRRGRGAGVCVYSPLLPSPLFLPLRMIQEGCTPPPPSAMLLTSPCPRPPSSSLHVNKPTPPRAPVTANTKTRDDDFEGNEEDEKDDYEHHEEEAGDDQDDADTLDFFREVKSSSGYLRPAPPSSASQQPSAKPAVNLKGLRVKGGWEEARFRDGQVVDLPVVFNSRIRSSGYGAEEQSGRGRGRGRGRGATAKGRGSGEKEGKRIRQYPVDADMMGLRYMSALDIDIGAPVLELSICADGSRLGVGGSDGGVSVVKMPKGESGYHVTTYGSHRGGVTSLCFSLSKHAPSSSSSSSSSKPSTAAAKGFLLLSGGREGGASMWGEAKSGDFPLVSFTHEKRQEAAGLGLGLGLGSTASGLKGGIRAATGRNRPYGAEVGHVQFFYQDKFVLMSVRHQLFLYQYDISPVSNPSSPSADLPRYLQGQGSYEQRGGWVFEKDAAQTGIVAVGAMNSAPSPLVICATTDRQLHVMDMHEGRCLRSWSCAHDKPPHTVLTPSPSPYCPHPRADYNVFFTSAQDNNIFMHDLRSSEVVRRFSSHVNRREKLGLALAPSLAYLATGSEDRGVYVYDLRMGREYVRYGGAGAAGGHRDVVSAVLFHPTFPVLISGSYDGKVKFYHDLSFM